MSRLRVIVAYTLSATTAALLGCSSDVRPSSDTGGAGHGVGGGGAGLDGSGGAATSAGGGGNAGCPQTELVPRSLATLVLVDRSDSMADAWSDVVAALTELYGGATLPGEYAALGFYPPQGAIDTCNPAAYDPPAVGFGPLPENADALEAAIAATGASGTSPTWFAMAGTYQYAMAWLEENPDKDVAVVLVSDGEPANCGGPEQVAVAGQADLAATAAEAGVRTFVVALPSGTVGALDPIAAAGGSELAYDLSAGAAALGETLVQIRERAWACAYLLPAIGDPAGVDVHYRPAGGEEAPLLHVTGAGDCGDALGWYYDDEPTPTMVLLCPALCFIVGAADSVTISEGCSTARRP